MGANDLILSKEFAIIHGGEVIAYATDFTTEINKEEIDITKLGDAWKQKKIDTKDFSVSFNGMVTRGDAITPYLWDPLQAYAAGDFVVLAGKAYEAQSATTGDNPSTDLGTNWIEVSVYSALATYDAGDLVYVTSVANEKRIYKSLTAANTGNDPLVSPTNWERLEANFESLLEDLRNNQESIVIALKPSGASTQYKYGNALLTTLSVAAKQGSVVTYAGKVSGTGPLSTATTPS